MTSDTHALELLHGGYLNLDWPDDYETVWDAVDDFVDHEPSAAELPKEVAALPLGAMSDQQVERLLLEKLNSGYWPEGDGISLHDWFAKLASYVEARLAKRTP